MTSPRIPGTVEHTLTEAVRSLSPEDVELATGKKLDTIFRKSNRNLARPMTFEEAVALEAISMVRHGTRRFGPLFDELVDRKIAELQGCQALPNEALATRILRLNVEVGHLAEEVEQAQANDGPGGSRITLSEWRNLLEAAEKVKTVVNQMMETARAHVSRS